MEGDPDLFSQLEANLPLLRSAEAVFKWISSPSDMAEVLWLNSADIVKIDVEGAEQCLLGVDSWVIRQHFEYMIEVHPNANLNAIINLFQQNGFEVTLGASMWFFWQIIHCKKY